MFFFVVKIIFLSKVRFFVYDMFKNENLRMYFNKIYCLFSFFYLFVLCCFIFNDYENLSYNIFNGFEIKVRFCLYYSEFICILKILFVKY